MRACAPFLIQFMLDTGQRKRMRKRPVRQPGDRKKMSDRESKRPSLPARKECAEFKDAVEKPGKRGPAETRRTALRANIRVQSRPSRATVGAIDFSVNFGTLPNLFLLVASTTPQILARCRKWSFSTVSKKSVSTRNPCDISEFGCFDPRPDAYRSGLPEV